jgi:Phage Mu protein F like protein
MATFENLIEQWDPVLRKAFLDSIANLRDAAQIQNIVRMLETGDIDGAIRAVGLNPVAFRPFDKAIAQAFEAAGSATEAIVPAAVATDGLRAVFQFNVRNREAEDWLRNNSSTLVTQILDDQRIMIRNALVRGMASGTNPRTVALDLVGKIGTSGRREGGLIGLTSSQEEWVSNYAAELASDTPTSALVRLLRDKRFDRAVIAAERDGQPLPASLISKMVTAYKNRALRFRGEAIARSEAILSMHEAQAQAMRQAIAQGIVSADTVTYIWRTAHDKRVRDSHQVMDGQTRKLGTPFVSGLGNILEYPGDQSAPPEDVINCRCWRETKIDFLAGIR